MDAATRKERRDISLEIWKLEAKRCSDCIGYVPHGDSMRCKCSVAKQIRKLGEQLIAISARTRKGRTEALIEQAKGNGLTMDIYRALREAKMHHKQINRLINMTQLEYHQWRYDNGLIDQAPRVVDENKVVGKVAEKNGLTVEDYRNAKKLGYLDKEIQEKYKISSWSLRIFKQDHGFILPRGHNSKYAHNNTNKREKVEA